MYKTLVSISLFVASPWSKIILWLNSSYDVFTQSLPPPLLRHCVRLLLMHCCSLLFHLHPHLHHFPLKNLFPLHLQGHLKDRRKLSTSCAKNCGSRFLCYVCYNLNALLRVLMPTIDVCWDFYILLLSSRQMDLWMRRWLHFIMREKWTF